MAYRKLISNVDWARAMRQVMSTRRGLKSQTALARKSGVAQSTIGRILRGEVNPQSANLELIAKAFGMSLAALVEMAQGSESGAEPVDDPKSAEGSARVPLISWAQAESFVNGLDPQPEAEAWMSLPGRGAGTFALRVRGESMEPSYQHGDIIVIEPDIAPEHGKDVVARLKGREDIVFKRLVIEGTLVYLKPANPHWPDKIIKVYPGIRIIGVVVGKWVRK